jgi:hypothetical protein
MTTAVLATPESAVQAAVETSNQAVTSTMTTVTEGVRWSLGGLFLTGLAVYGGYKVLQNLYNRA